MYVQDVGGTSDLRELISLIAKGDSARARRVVLANLTLPFEGLSRPDECFVEDVSVQTYEGDTALHAAAFSFDVALAQFLVERGAAVRARNRRGAEPLHAAVRGGPGSPGWSPVRQCATIAYLISAGADPNARAAGGVTPLHRAVRNRCSGAVELLLQSGADPLERNDRGSDAASLATWTTGRGGTGSAEAKAEQRRIIELLARA